MTIGRVGAGSSRPGHGGLGTWRRHSAVRGRRLTVAEAVGERLVATRLGAWSVVHLVSPIDRKLLSRSNGRRSIGRRYYRTGLLQTVGARTGRTRTVPLQYVVDGDRVILVGSNGGATRSPAWAHNLRSEPRCSLSSQDEIRRFRAREVQGDERDAVWATASDWYQGYDEYQRRARPRVIPVFVLEPEDGPGGTGPATPGDPR